MSISFGEKYRLLREVQYLIEQLSLLQDIDEIGNHLEVVVNNIKIKDKRSYQPFPPPSQQAPSQQTQPGQRPSSSIMGMGMNASSASKVQDASKRASTFFGKMMLRPTSSTPSPPPAPSGTPVPSGGRWSHPLQEDPRET